MSGLIDAVNGLISEYNRLWTLVDHRVDGWFLMSSAVPTVCIVIIYLSFVYYASKWMQNRQRFNFKWLIIVYNLSLTALNLYILLELKILASRLGYSWLCEPIRDGTDSDNKRILTALHWFMISKLIELMDTTFIVLRKKHVQLSPLHVYHHSTIFLFSWIGMRWFPGGSVVYISLCNAFVHSVMYFYYFLSTFGPAVSKYLWWKRYITILQLFQFVLAVTLGVNGYYLQCPFPKWTIYGFILYMAIYVLLFGQFYNRTYNRINKSEVSDQNGCLKMDPKKGNFQIKMNLHI